MPGSVAYGVSADPAGNAYVTGSTSAVDFPVTAGAFQQTSAVAQGQSTAFVSKLNADGSQLVFSTFLGGSYPCGTAPPSFTCLQPGDPYGLETGSAIAIDSAGSVYVTGYTSRPDFPISAGALQTKLVTTWAPFVAKLNSTGSSLVYSTFLGGSDANVAEFFLSSFDYTTRIAVNAKGDAYSYRANS